EKEIKVVDLKVTLTAEGTEGNHYFDSISGRYLTGEVTEEDASHALLYTGGTIVHVNRGYHFMPDMPYGKDPRKGEVEYVADATIITPVVGMEFGVEIGGGPISVCKITAVTDTQVDFLCTTYTN
ncbi:hypothetical protein ACFL3D_06950, partial [Candidatus Omnitrophota bacterium]